MNFKQTAKLLLGGLVLAAGVNLHANENNKNIPATKQGTSKSIQVDKVIKDVSIVVINGKEIKINGLKDYNNELIGKLNKMVDETNDVEKLQDLKNLLGAFIPNLSDIKVGNKNTLNQLANYFSGLNNLNNRITKKIEKLDKNQLLQNETNSGPTLN